MLISFMQLGCNKSKEGTLDKLVNKNENKTPQSVLEKLHPHVDVLEGNKSNEFGINQCDINLVIGNSIENIDSFFPSYIERKELIYCDIGRNASLLEGIVDVNDLRNELYPNKYGKLLTMALATTAEERLYIPINRYCVFINSSFITVTKDVVNEWNMPKKDTIKDFEVVFKKSLKTIIDESKNPSINNKNDANSNEKIVENNQKQFEDIQLTLLDASIKKANLYLGEPDKEEHGFGHVSKGFAIYYNKVLIQNGKPKHLVLFLRMDGRFWGNNAKIEEIYSVDDNEKACFGIHCIKIINQEIYTNALDLIYDRNYKSL